MSGTYNDNEKLDYEGVLVSLTDIYNRVNEGSELHKEILKLNELANELTMAWTSDTSRNAKSKIDEVNNELAKLRTQLNNLIEELGRYNQSANTINDGNVTENTD